MTTPEQRIDNLEAIVALQEDLLGRLDKLVGDQQVALYRLQEEVAKLHDHLRQIDPAAVRDPKDEEPPPHY